ncbi:amidohydrolase [Mycoplasmatota bacterium zrk1]
MKLIKNAYLISAAEVNYKVMDILIEDSKISKVGKINEKEYTCEVIDVKEKWVTPGFIDPHCHIGLYEESIGFEGLDVNEMTDPSTPNLKGYDAIYPYDVSFKDAVKGGVTSVSTGPGSANVIGGTFSVIKTVGNNVEEMVVKEEVAMKMALGENPKRVYNTKKVTPSTRMGSAAIMRRELTKAKEYYDKMQKHIKEDGDKPTYDDKSASLARVFDGMLVKVHAHRTDDIQTAIRICKEFKLNYTIEHCTEAHLMVDDLLKDNVRVIIGPTLGTKSKYELRNKSFKTCGILEKAGVEFSIMTDHPVMSLSDTRVQTAIMIREGLSELGAIKAMTINAAKLNEVDDRIGSIEEGKDADIVIWTGNPFEYLTVTDTVLIDGEIVYQKED